MPAVPKTARQTGSKAHSHMLHSSCCLVHMEGNVHDRDVCLNKQSGQVETQRGKQYTLQTEKCSVCEGGICTHSVLVCRLK